MGDTATVTMLFCDLVGSTERQSRLGDEAADDFRRRFFAALRGATTGAGGTVIKNLGDGLMVVFEQSTVGALICAEAMHLAVSDLDPADPPRLRIGISVGEVGHEDDDWFGTPVVEAARLCAAASSGQTLATAVVRTLVGSRAGHHRFTPLAPMRLKGLAEPVEVVAVEAAAAPEGIDPTSIGGPALSPSPPPRRPAVQRGRVMAGVATAVAVIMVIGAAWALGDDDQTTGVGPKSASTTTKPRLNRPVGYQPRYERIDCDAAVSAATPDAECGRLLVPEVRSSPQGRSIHVDVVRVPALTGPSSPPVLLVDVNEPVAATPLRSEADVYAITPRGFSPTETPQLTCPQLRDAWRPTLDLPSADPAALDTRVAAAAACAASLRESGVQLEGYNMAEVATDLRDLVIALRLDRVSVAASGFATSAAVEFARSNAGVVVSMLLTNPTPPGESALAQPTLYLSKRFDVIAALCSADPRCVARFGDLRAAFTSRVAEYAAGPRQVMTVPLGPADVGVKVMLDGRRMSAALAAALSSTSQLSIVPTALSPGGVSPELLAAAAINDERHYFGPDSAAGATLSYTCSYDATMNRTAELSDAALKDFSGANDPTFQRLCGAWNVPSVVDVLSRPLVGDLPVLLVEGGVSVAGVNHWSEEMAAQLSHATVLRLATVSEDASYVQPPCMRELRKRFLEDPNAVLNVAACEQATPPIEFVGLG